MPALPKFDMRMDKKSSIASYRRLLAIFLDKGFAARTHIDWLRRPAGKSLMLRHDIDHSLDRAFEMAKLERELGVVSTYYALTPGSYKSEGSYYGTLENGKLIIADEMVNVLLQMQAMGHEIGIHNDFIQLGKMLDRDPGELFAEQVALFRECGIDISGTASHGSKFAREKEFTNYELFSETKKKKLGDRNIDLGNGRVFPLYSVSYRAAGLEYEAYEVPGDARLSDAGGKLHVFARYGNTHLSDLVLGPVDMGWLEEKIEGANTARVLIHADWWKAFNMQDETL